jgi:hypothetical protein
MIFNLEASEYAAFGEVIAKAFSVGREKLDIIDQVIIKPFNHVSKNLIPTEERK